VEGFGDPVAPSELTWALIMAASRRLPQYISNLREGQWQTVSQNPAYNLLGVALKGRTLGIWSYGKIGSVIAGYGRAFGMDVVVWGREGSTAAAKKDGYRVAASREEFFEQADIISLHLRLNEATEGIVKVEDLKRMKTSAMIVNTSRAELIAPGALLEALQSGRPGYAALDVYESEPLNPTDPLLRMENVIATPHLGYVEQNGYELYFKTAFQNVLDFAAGKHEHVLNPEALKAR
jgi:D-3-phosphoglycerate dehydrogenase